MKISGVSGRRGSDAHSTVEGTCRSLGTHPTRSPRTQLTELPKCSHLGSASPCTPPKVSPHFLMKTLQSWAALLWLHIPTLSLLKRTLIPSSQLLHLESFKKKNRKWLTDLPSLADTLCFSLKPKPSPHERRPSGAHTSLGVAPAKPPRTGRYSGQICVPGSSWSRQDAAQHAGLDCPAMHPGG